MPTYTAFCLFDQNGSLKIKHKKLNRELIMTLRITSNRQKSACQIFIIPSNWIGSRFRVPCSLGFYCLIKTSSATGLEFTWTLTWQLAFGTLPLRLFLVIFRSFHHNGMQIEHVHKPDPQSRFRRLQSGLADRPALAQTKSSSG